MIRAAVVGGAGYAGGEVLRLLAGHPEVEVVQVTSERLAGKLVASVHPPLRGRTELRFSSRDTLGDADVVFVAMSHGESSAAIDCPAASQRTRELLGWQPKQPDLIPEIDRPSYFET